MVSVIINVYNSEKYIRKCLDSVLNQTYKDLEIVIVNDGSTDNTLAICESYKDDRIIIINQENRGLAFSRNVGIENSKGEYLYFIDSDDFIERDTIQYLYDLCKKYNVEISSCNQLDIYSYDVSAPKINEHIEVISNKEMIRKILLWEDRTEAIWNKLIKRELFNNLRFEDRIINDIAFTYKIAMTTDKIAYSNLVKYYYLRHKGSVSDVKKEDLPRTIDMYNACLERYNYIKNVYPDFLANECGLLYIIARLYLRENKEIIEFLNKQGAVKLFNQLFSIKLLCCKMKFKEKIKLILFRINPNLHRNIINCYLRIKRKLT